MTIAEAVEKTYEALPYGNFSGIVLWTNTKRLARNPSLREASVMRSLRRLRSDNKINYILVGKRTGLYSKERMT